MKNVYILEKFASHEDLVKDINDTLAMKANVPEEMMETFVSMVNVLQNVADENPEGKWFGFEGKEQYRSFVYVAKNAIRRNPNVKFRVVKAEINDDAEYWTGYKNPVIKENILRYLYATI